MSAALRSSPAHADASVELKVRLFRGFAEPSRLDIVEALLDGERTVSEICRATGLSQPNVSNHLACLLGCGLVAREQRGRFAYYWLADERIEALLSVAEELALGVAAGVAPCPRCGATTW